ncbi:unnamed protein product [Paramecium primaurelia]|uniref:Uncharacterized protein n=1 Tax=Paramecium primaurelia TaxID=5886 RepID=A0A8S1N0K1_PARPR|nr:unnamed protein product [Paramecium primaurelia]
MNQSYQNESHKKYPNNWKNLFPKFRDVIDRYDYFDVNLVGCKLHQRRQKNWYVIVLFAFQSIHLTLRIKFKKQIEKITLKTRTMKYRIHTQKFVQFQTQENYLKAAKIYINHPQSNQQTRLKQQIFRDYSQKEFMHLISYQCKSMNQVNALTRFQKSINIPISPEMKDIIKQKKTIFKEIAEKRPHRSRELKYYQMFLDELFICKRGFLAFRLFILYELSARISELSQISFSMLINGLINYVQRNSKEWGKS